MRKLLSLSILLLSWSIQVNAQNLSSPYQTIFTHLDNLQRESYNPEVSAAAIPLTVQDPERRMELAIHIKQVLDGKGLYIHMKDLPTEENYMDSLEKEHIYILDELEPRIYVEKQGDSWYYSEETIASIDKMYDEVFPFGTKIFSRLLPASFRNTHVLGLYAWQWLGIALLLASGMLGYLFIHRLVKFILNYLLYKKEIVRLENEEHLKKLAKAFSLLVVFFILSKIVPSLQFPPLVLQYIVKSINILLTFLGAIFVVRLFNLVLSYFKDHVEKTDSKLDDQLLPIVSKLFKLLVSVLAISIALKQLNVNLTAIIAGLSIGGLALALASQDTVKNFIGTVTILLDHPFEIGDYVIVNGIEGTVEEVGMRATRIRTPAQSLAYVPNGDLSNMIVDNLGLRIYRRWKWNMGVEYGTKPSQIQDLCERAKQTINENPHVAGEKTVVHLNELGDSSINILMLVYLDVPSYNDELSCKHNLLLELIKLADEMNVEFAFPSQTLYVKK